MHQNQQGTQQNQQGTQQNQQGTQQNQQGTQQNQQGTHENQEGTLHIIDTVERGSPADAAGLQEGDRVIELNGKNVEKEGQEEVAMKIKESQRSRHKLISLLVADREADYYTRKEQVTQCSQMNFTRPISVCLKDNQTGRLCVLHN